MTDAAELHEIVLPSVGQYVIALRRTMEHVGPKQREILQELLKIHNAAPGRVASAGKLAEGMRALHFDFPNYNTVNLHYGLLAKELAKHLPIPDRQAVEVGVFVDFVPPGYTSNTEYLWVLKQPVAEAIEVLGWVPRVSHLLYPHEALAKIDPAASVHGA